MPFYLWKAVLGRRSKIEIDQTEYDSILTSWRSLIATLEIEEEWDNLLQNYVELEMELLRSAMHSMVTNHESYDQMQQIRLGFSRRLSNLLSGCRSYLDHTPHYLGAITTQAFAEPFKRLTNRAYDGNFSYRFMEALRNYAQHRGVPLHGATFDSKWVGEERDESDVGFLRYAVGANIDLEKIQAGKDFKAKVLAEVDGDLTHLDVVTVTREYVEALGEVHDQLRKLMEAAVAEWEATISNAISRYAAANENDVVGLCAVDLSDDGRLIAQQDIFDDMPARLERLMRRNGSLMNLRRRYVTNQILPPKRSRKRRSPSP